MALKHVNKLEIFTYNFITTLLECELICLKKRYFAKIEFKFCSSHHIMPSGRIMSTPGSCCELPADNVSNELLSALHPFYSYICNSAICMSTLCYFLNNL